MYLLREVCFIFFKFKAVVLFRRWVSLPQVVDWSIFVIKMNKGIYVFLK